MSSKVKSISRDSPFKSFKDKRTILYANQDLVLYVRIRHSEMNLEPFIFKVLRLEATKYQKLCFLNINVK